MVSGLIFNEFAVDANVYPPDSMKLFAVTDPNTVCDVVKLLFLILEANSPLN